MEIKTCAKCEEPKPVSQFNKDRQQRSGIHPYCKSCQAWYAAERYKRKKLEINRKNNEWYAANSGKRLAKMKQVRKGDIFNMKNRIYAGNRRARAKNLSDGTVTYPRILQIMEKQNWNCNDCGVTLLAKKPHLDHVIPLAKGGRHSITNLQWLCRKCNLSKGAKVG